MIQAHVQSLLHGVKTRAKSNDRLYNLVYDLANVAEFSDLYEHEKMLADAVRVNIYSDAIRGTVSEDDVVVDLGTGSGLLAMLAARQGATVYAIDHADFIDVAERIATENGFTDIEFVQIHSRDFECPEPVDVVIHEQMGDDLFNEMMVENLLDLRERVLKDDGIVLPGEFELFLEPVTLHEAHRHPFLSDLSVEGIDFDFPEYRSVTDTFRPSGYARRFIERGALDHFLSTPRPVLSFDLNELNAPADLPTNLSTTRPVEEPGVMDGLCLYFRSIFGNGIEFDTAPTSPTTSWRNRLLRTQCREFDLGDEIAYAVEMDPLYNTGMWSVESGPQ